MPFYNPLHNLLQHNKLQRRFLSIILEITKKTAFIFVLIFLNHIIPPPKVFSHAPNQCLSSTIEIRDGERCGIIQVEIR
ncbi:hypothetical protein HMPREF9138_01363 [Prevotella histicola F0411]|uniref:Uncharacterized protein n=1 Tax=Prevotella histicola F0411 TaxID=857291 RepID=G6AH17_9BACT|nr:hypothetical protein HMPREF9138_01363 [Prevotella histicola F0411]